MSSWNWRRSSALRAGGRDGALRMLRVRRRRNQLAAPMRHPRLHGRPDSPVREDSLEHHAGRHPPDVVGRLEVGHEGRIHAEEAVELLHDGERVALEVIEQEDVDLLAGKALVVARELLVVAADPHPVRIGAGPRQRRGARSRSGSSRRPRLRRIHLIVRVRPVHRVAQPADDARRRDRRLDPPRGLRTLQVHGGRFPHRRRVAGAGEQGLVLRQRPDRKPVDLGVSLQQPALIVHAVGEVVGLLHRAHEDRRVLREIPVQRGRARPWRRRSR